MFKNKPFLIIILVVLFSYIGMNSMITERGDSDSNLRTKLAYLTLIIEVFILFISITSKLRFPKFTSFVRIVFVWFVLMLILVFINSNDIARIFKNIIYISFWPICFISSYYFVRKNSLNINRFINSYSIIFVLNLLLYINYYIYNYSIQSTFEGINQIYYLVLITPWLFLIKKKRIKHLFILILFTSTLASFKRNSIIILSLIILYYYFNSFYKSSFRKKLIKIFFILTLLSLFSYISFKNDATNFLLERFEFSDLEKTTGRKAIWSEVIKNQNNSTGLEWLIGHGHNTVSQYVSLNGTRLTAHNDFLEVLFDYGIIIFILYLTIYFYLIKRFFYIKKYMQNYTVSYASSILIFIGMSWVSHLITYPTYFVFLASFWGAMEALIYISKKNNSIDINALSNG